MVGEIRVRLRREIRDDFLALPSDDHRREALKFLAQLKTNPTLGQPLKSLPETADLSDCRKIYFDKNPQRRPGYRIVYRLRPSESDPEEADIVVIGPRANLRAYREAGKRLGR